MYQQTEILLKSVKMFLRYWFSRFSRWRVKKSRKRHTLAWVCINWAIKRENLASGM